MNEILSRLARHGLWIVFGQTVAGWSGGSTDNPLLPRIKQLPINTVRRGGRSF